jgi:hypothetical protein
MEERKGEQKPMKFIHSIMTGAWAVGLKVITLRCESCQRSLTLRNISAHKAGIWMSDHWYCSSTCFASAAEAQLAELVTSRHEPANRVERMPLELMLVSQGLLSSAEFREVRDEQKEVGGEIGELLVRRGTVSEKQVTALRATQWGCPVFALPEHVAEPSVHIPLPLMQLYSMIPLHYVAATNLLLVGFVGGVEYGLLYAIEKMTGCKTEPCFVTPSDFRMQMQQRQRMEMNRREDNPREVKFESVHSSVEMARILSSYGAHLEAEEALIERCREYLWARLKCGPKNVDLLFKAG